MEKKKRKSPKKNEKSRQTKREDYLTYLNQRIDCLVHLRKFFILFIVSPITHVLLIVCVQMLIFFVIVMRPKCFSSMSNRKISQVEDHFSSLLSKIIPVLQEKLALSSTSLRRRIKKPCEVLFNGCGSLPPDAQGVCDVRFGFDTNCSCVNGRKIYHDHGIFSDVSLEHSSYNYYSCLQREFNIHFKDIFNRISNEGYIVTDLFIHFFDDPDSNNIYYVFPGRKLGNAIYAEDEEGETEYKCLINDDENHNPKEGCRYSMKTVEEQNWYKNNFNEMTDFVLLYDNTKPENDFIKNFEKTKLIPKILSKIFVANKVLFLTLNKDDGLDGFTKDTYSQEGFSEMNLYFNTKDFQTQMLDFFHNYVQYDEANKGCYNLWETLYSIEKRLGELKDSTEIQHIIFATHCTIFPAVGPSFKFSGNTNLFDSVNTKKILSILYTGNDEESIKLYQEMDNQNDNIHFHHMTYLMGYSNDLELNRLLNEQIVHFGKSIEKKKILFVEDNESDDEFNRNEKIITATYGVKIPPLEDGMVEYSAIMGMQFFSRSFYLHEDDTCDVLLNANRNPGNEMFILSLSVNIIMSIVIYICGFVCIIGMYFILVKWLKEIMMFRTYSLIIISFTFIAQRIWENYYYGNYEYFLGMGIISIVLIIWSILLPIIASYLRVANLPKLQSKSSTFTKGIYNELNFGLEIKNYCLLINEYAGYVPRILFAPGKLVGILGHSSSGKTQFSNFLLSMPLYYAKIFSDIDIFVYSKYFEKGYKGKLTSMMDLRDYIGFVPQQVILPEYLTVKESIKFDLSQKYRSLSNVARSIIEKLKLTNQMNKFTSELSGGALKRLSIAKTLLKGFPVIVMDEPSSGLDEALALNLFKMLKEISNCGFTVICNIHQASQELINELDDVYLFCLHKKKMRGFKVPKNEKQINYILKNYEGDSKRVMDRLKTQTKFDDSFVRKHVFDVKNSFKEIQNEIQKQDLDLLRKSSLFQKIYYLLARSILQELRNWKNMLVDILNVFLASFVHIFLFSSAQQFQGMEFAIFEHCIKSFCLDSNMMVEDNGNVQCSSDSIERMCAFPKHSNIFNTNFSLTFGLSFVTMCSALSFFSSEKNVIKREAAEGINLFFYFITKLLVKAMRYSFLTFLFTIVSLSGICLQGSFFEYFIICLSVSFWTIGFAVFISLFFPEKQNSSESFMIGIIMLFCNNYLSAIFVPAQDLVENSIVVTLLKCFRYISYAYHSIQQLFTLETMVYKNVYEKSVETLWKYYEFDHSYWNVIALIGMGFVFFCFAYCVLILLYSNIFFVFLSKMKDKFVYPMIDKAVYVAEPLKRIPSLDLNAKSESEMEYSDSDSDVEVHFESDDDSDEDEDRKLFVHHENESESESSKMSTSNSDTDDEDSSKEANPQESNSESESGKASSEGDTTESDDSEKDTS